MLYIQLCTLIALISTNSANVAANGSAKNLLKHKYLLILVHFYPQVYFERNLWFTPQLPQYFIVFVIALSSLFVAIITVHGSASNPLWRHLIIAADAKVRNLMLRWRWRWS